MAFPYTKHLTPRGRTPQGVPIPGREAEMAPNAAGGYGFALDAWARLDRFLVLGTEGGTYYVLERELTIDNAAVLTACIAEDGLGTVRRIAEISERALAPRNDAAIFALAVAAKRGDEATRRAAYEALPAVCRTGTHLFAFAGAIDALGGWSRGARGAVGRWYTAREPGELAYQLVKYRQREGWTHADVLRLAHPKPAGGGDGIGALLAFAVGKEPDGALPRIVEGYLAAQSADTPHASARLVAEYRLPRECVRIEHLGEPEVLEALLASMPYTAMIRNLGNLTAAGVVAPLSDGARRVIDQLADAARLRKARVHPMAIFLALRTYASGQGLRGRGEWTPVQQVVDALDGAFYAAMDGVVPTGRRILLAVDVSGSMTMAAGGIPVPAAEAAAAMALIVARTEPDHLMLGVNTGPVELAISPRMRLDAAIATVRRAIAGGTDLSVPARWLARERLVVDGVVILTDSETWAGRQHPSEAMEQYRRQVGAPVRNVVAAMSATGSSIGDPVDPLTLQCAGLDATVPEVIRGFVSGAF
jgi:60 kDa SS-A/Ro ribonucleoprotein